MLAVGLPLPDGLPSNRESPHAHNDGLAPAMVEEKPKNVSEIS